VAHALSEGLEGFSDAALLALLDDAMTGAGDGGCERRQRHEALLEAVGGLTALARRGVGDLAERHGLGPNLGARLCAAIELGSRIARMEAADAAEQLGRANDVERWARRRLSSLDHEELWVLLVDGRNRMRGARPVARGGLHACAVLARDVLSPVVREAVSAFVLVHNHPGGDPCPSREDVQFTRRVAAGADAVGVVLVDHVVVSRGGAVSMLEAGLLDDPRDELGLER
jgi:DNA repair protein RadC